LEEWSTRRRRGGREVGFQGRRVELLRREGDQGGGTRFVDLNSRGKKGHEDLGQQRRSDIPFRISGRR